MQIRGVGDLEYFYDPKYYPAVGIMLDHLELGDTANAGMLFVFEQKAGHCFWMKNTELPLSIAFLADDGTIVNIEDMRPHSEDNHCPKAAIRYALEMNQGWFAQKGIKAGAKIGGLPAQ